MSAGTRPSGSAPTGAAASAEFEALLAPVLPRAYAAARFLTREGSDAEDLVQDSVLAAWKGFAGFRSGTNFRAWFLRILTNVFYSKRRRRLRRGETVPLEEADDARLVAAGSAAPGGGATESPSAAFLRRIDVVRVEDAIRSLPDEYRTVAALYFVEELSYREIAAAVGRPLGTVRSRIHRGRKLLQAALRPLAGEHGIAPHPENSRERKPARTPARRPASRRDRPATNPR